MLLTETIVGKLASIGIPILIYLFLITMISAYIGVKPKTNFKRKIKSNSFKNYMIIFFFFFVTGLTAQAINMSYNIVNFNKKLS